MMFGASALQWRPIGLQRQQRLSRMQRQPILVQPHQESSTLGMRSTKLQSVVDGGSKSAETAETADAPKTVNKNAMVVPLTVARPAAIPWEDIIMFQAFGWESSKQDGTWYSTIQGRIKELQKAEITHVWLPPPSVSVAPEGYLPTQLYDINSKYGDAKSLVSLTTSLLKAGIRPVADIVINHRSADEQNSEGTWNEYRDDIPHPGRKIDWGPWAITSGDPEFNGTGNPDSGENYGPCPDLDHSNTEVQKGILGWLKWLRECVGYEGWRLDFAKGYAAEYAKFYIENSVKPGKDFCVGEFWADAAWEDSDMSYNQDHMRQQLCDWVAGAEFSACFDFTTKAQLQEAVKNCQFDRLKDDQGKPSGMLGWNPSKAVTFIDNHDTGSSQQHWPFPQGGEMAGYAYIMTHPGIPCILWEHFFDNGMGDQITQLAALRRRAGVRADSKIEILAAEKDIYVARIAERVVCKLGPRFDMGDLEPSAKEGWVMVLSGNDWAVWELPQ